MKQYDVQVGHAAIWVHGPEGECLGRFGKMGIDIHRSLADQEDGKGECLDCTHGLTTKEHWLRFKAGMLEHYSVDLSALTDPSWI